MPVPFPPLFSTLFPRLFPRWRRGEHVRRPDGTLVSSAEGPGDESPGYYQESLTGLDPRKAKGLEIPSAAESSSLRLQNRSENDRKRRSALNITMAHTAAERNSDLEWLPPWTRLEHAARYKFASQFVRGKGVVDCACGTGIGSILFATNGAMEVRAIDSSEVAVAEARKAGTYSNLEVTLGDAVHTGLPDAFADVFISLETIEHIQDDEAFIEEVYRVLKPGGVFICSTPNREVTNPATTIADTPWNPHHVREYNLNELRARVEAGFETQGVYGQNPVFPWWRQFMRNLALSVGTSWAIKLNKLLKCRWFLISSPGHHEVRQVSSDLDYEFHVLVCRRR